MTERFNGNGRKRKDHIVRREELLSPFDPDELVVVNGVGVDLARGEGRARKKEDPSFESYFFEKISHLLSAEDKRVLVGPHYVDYVLGYSQYAQRRRPDAFEFAVEDDFWVLVGLYEFKSGKKLHASKKLPGFSDLLVGFRNNPAFLPQLFLPPLQNVVFIPSQVIVPPDEAIAVEFVFPHTGPSFWIETGFQVGITTIPLQRDEGSSLQ